MSDNLKNLLTGAQYNQHKNGMNFPSHTDQRGSLSYAASQQRQRHAHGDSIHGMMGSPYSQRAVMERREKELARKRRESRNKELAHFNKGEMEDLKQIPGAVKDKTAEFPNIAKQGRDKDTKVGEINEKTANALDQFAHQGHEQRNPRTGLREYGGTCSSAKGGKEDKEWEAIHALLSDRNKRKVKKEHKKSKNRLADIKKVLANQEQEVKEEQDAVFSNDIGNHYKHPPGTQTRGVCQTMPFVNSFYNQVHEESNLRKEYNELKAVMAAEKQKNENEPVSILSQDNQALRVPSPLRDEEVFIHLANEKNPTDIPIKYTGRDRAPQIGNKTIQSRIIANKLDVPVTYGGVPEEKELSTQSARDRNVVDRISKELSNQYKNQKTVGFGNNPFYHKPEKDEEFLKQVLNHQWNPNKSHQNNHVSSHEVTLFDHHDHRARGHKRLDVNNRPVLRDDSVTVHDPNKLKPYRAEYTPHGTVYNKEDREFFRAHPSVLPPHPQFKLTGNPDLIIHNWEKRSPNKLENLIKDVRSRKIQKKQEHQREKKNQTENQMGSRQNRFDRNNPYNI